ncbi:CHAT domain-containing protein [Streptomyces europaeiscabiei]|uniref:CHAT domain-containing protein n=1 Tax=Streptomyces europaeiscabiei TaxID=146819 RepID=UPI0029A2D976|nr:CHAT domain-containing protein [Streptomyces europaeiscabiei]MDX3583433.1 tetratricopeptide repeat protein [Streptomyces europaeiscabiei]
MTLFLPTGSRRRRQISPGALLKAEAEVVPFHGREAELATLADWCNGSRELDFSLLVGPGGQGKTRFARELVRQRTGDGWAAGFLNSDTHHESIDFSSLVDSAVPVLLVVDYAETRTKQLARLLNTLGGASSIGRIRILLLARSADRWWNDLRRRHIDLLESTSIHTLATLDNSPDSRREAFHRAIDSFAQALSSVDARTNWRKFASSAVTPDDLYTDEYSSPLALQMAALFSLLQNAARKGTDDQRTELIALEGAVEIYRSRVSAGHTELVPDLASVLLRQADVLAERGSHTAGLTAVHEAVRILRTLIQNTPTLLPNFADALHSLAVALVTVGRREEGLAAVEESIQVYRSLIRSKRGEFNSGLARSLNTLATILADLGSREESLTAAEEALQTYRRLEASQVGDFRPNVAATLSNLSISMAGLGRRNEAMDAASNSVLLYRELAAEKPTAYGPDLAATLNNLSNRLRALGRIQEALAAVEEATAIRRNLAANRPEAFTPDLAVSLNNFSVLLADSGETHGALASITEAVALYRTLATQHPDAFTPDLAASLNNLSVQQADAGDIHGALASITECVQMRRALTESNPAAFLPDLAASLNNLSARQYEIGDPGAALSSITEAVQHYRALTESNPTAFRVSLAAALHNLWRHRSGQLGDLAALDEAVAAGRHAIAVTPADHPDRARYLSNLSNTLQARYERTGSSEALDEALEVARQAVLVTPADHPDRARYLSNLGNTLQARYERTGDIPTLEEAVTVERQAVQVLPTDHPDQAKHLIRLGNTLQKISALTGSNSRSTEAMRAFREASYVLAAPAVERVLASCSWGTSAAERGEWREALNGFSKAIELLPVAAESSPVERVRRNFLAAVENLPSDAAAIALQVAEPMLAVTLLERGRGVLLTQALRGRTDLNSLRSHAPELANRMERTRRGLEVAEQEIISASQAGNHLSANREATGRLQELRREWENLLSLARSIPGWSDFLMAPGSEQFKLAASDGPVVLLNVSRYRSDALAITDNGVQVVPLPDLTVDTLNSRVAEFRTRLRAEHRSDTQQYQDDLLGILEWLWLVAAGPVLGALGYHAPPKADQNWPRVWWCPTGALTLLPLHAAGQHHGRAHTCVLDRVVSSYTPTLSALLKSRDRLKMRKIPPSRNVLIVAVPDALSLGPLSIAKSEARIVGRHFFDARSLIGSEATRDAVLASIPQYSWFHFTGHIRQAVDPTQCALFFQDHQATGPVTVAEIVNSLPARAELAFLSGRATELPPAQLHPDESVAAAAAFNLAGFPHAIGTLWDIPGESASRFAELFYSYLSQGGNIQNADRASCSVHAAVRKLRAQYPESPATWGSYVHVGP